jgi:hypothetical protein
LIFPALFAARGAFREFRYSRAASALMVIRWVAMSRRGRSLDELAGGVAGD